MSVQQKSLNFLAKVVLDNRIALAYLLAERGGPCAVAYASCCAWIYTSGIVAKYKQLTNTPHS